MQALMTIHVSLLLLGKSLNSRLSLWGLRPLSFKTWLWLTSHPSSPFLEFLAPNLTHHTLLPPQEPEHLWPLSSTMFLLCSQSSMAPISLAVKFEVFPEAQKALHNRHHHLFTLTYPCSHVSEGNATWAKGTHELSVCRVCIHPFLLGCSICWHIIVYSSLLWFFVFLWCWLKCLSSHFWSYWFGTSLFLMTKGLSALFIFSKSQLFVSLIFCIVFSLCFICLCSDLYYFFPFTNIGLFWFLF